MAPGHCTQGFNECPTGDTQIHEIRDNVEARLREPAVAS